MEAKPSAASAMPLRWPTELPKTTRRRLPASVYTDPERFRKELEVVRRSWQIACRASEIVGAGDTSLFEAYGETVAVVRQADGSVRAWHNVCQHRGTRLICEAVKGARRFICPYHHWNFGLDGSLVSLPGRKHFDAEGVSGVRTPPVHVEERHGWVWINLSQDPESLVDALAELDEELAGQNMSEARLLAPPLTFEIQSNWKRGLEAFIEIYHAPFLHSRTIPAGSVDFQDTAHSLFARNSMMVYPMHHLRAELEQTGDHRRFAAMQCLFYPNTNFNHTPTSFQMYDFQPVAVDRTVMRLYVLSHGAAPQPTPDAIAAEIDYLKQVFGEDIHICREQSQTARSSGFTEVLLGDEECRIAHVIDNLDEDIRALAKQG